MFFFFQFQFLQRQRAGRVRPRAKGQKSGRGRGRGQGRRQGQGRGENEGVTYMFVQPEHTNPPCPWRKGATSSAGTRATLHYMDGRAHHVRAYDTSRKDNVLRNPSAASCSGSRGSRSSRSSSVGDIGGGSICKQSRHARHALTRTGRNREGGREREIPTPPRPPQQTFYLYPW